MILIGLSPCSLCICQNGGNYFLFGSFLWVIIVHSVGGKGKQWFLVLELHLGLGLPCLALPCLLSQYKRLHRPVSPTSYLPFISLYHTFLGLSFAGNPSKSYLISVLFPPFCLWSEVGWGKCWIFLTSLIVCFPIVLELLARCKWRKLYIIICWWRERKVSSFGYGMSFNIKWFGMRHFLICLVRMPLSW